MSQLTRSVLLVLIVLVLAMGKRTVKVNRDVNHVRENIIPCST